MSEPLVFNRLNNIMQYPNSQTIADVLSSSKRIVIIAGAGISTSAGIPDFRSSGGLYHGGQLFEAAAFFDSRKAQLLRTALRLQDLAVVSEPTDTHRWIAKLSPKLLRCYTQNVDMLEKKAGLETGIGRSFDCIPLHGSLSHLECHLCHMRYDWSDYRRVIEDSDAEDAKVEPNLTCPGCQSRNETRQKAGLRRLAAGQLKPSMVMLDEAHPEGEEIAAIARRDTLADPDLLLVMGTSLKVDGPKSLFRQFARRVRKSGGVIIYVNQTKPPSGCKAMIDHWVQREVDEWVRDLNRRDLSFGSSAKKRLRNGGRRATRLIR